MNPNKSLFLMIAAGMCTVVSITLFFIAVDVGCKYYGVWGQRMVGKAELARAEFNRNIAICEAKAKKESADCEADAEIIRARGVAEANKIIGDSLQGNEAYLRYRWIEGLQTNQMQTIYVPVEAGLPILEAGKR